MIKEKLLKVIDFTQKHQDFINLTRAYLGVFLFVYLIITYTNFFNIGFDLNGILNSQVEEIIKICMIGGSCP